MALTGHVLICPGLGLACSCTEGRAAQGNGDSVMGDLGGTGCTSRDGTASLGAMQDEYSGTVTVRDVPDPAVLCPRTATLMPRLGTHLPPH